MSLVLLAHTCSHLQNASLARLGLTSIPYTKLHLQIALLLQRQGFFSTVDIAGPTPPLQRLPEGVQSRRRTVRQKHLPHRERLLNKAIGLREELQAEATDEAPLNMELLRKNLVNWADGALERKKFYGTSSDLLGKRHFSEKSKGKWWNSDDLKYAIENCHRSRHDVMTNGIAVEAMGLTIEGQPLDSTTRTIDTSTEGIITQENRASRRLWLGLKYWNGEPVLQKARMISKPSKRMWLNTADIARVIRGGQAGEVKGLTKLGEIMAISTDKGIMDARECVERRIGGQPLARFY